MLDRSSIPAPLTGTAGDSIRQAILTGPTSGLIRLTAILVVVSALTCVYLWQASQVAALNSKIVTVRAQTAKVEREYAQLILDVAKWCSPAYIEQKAAEMGLVVRSLATRVAVPGATEAPQPATPDLTASGGLWERLRSWLPRSVGASVGVQRASLSWFGR